ncbi:MAG: serine O-acetyltransferase [Solirubrobacteraceae bacterium]
MACLRSTILSSGDSAWGADRRWYPPRAWLREQSIWSVAVYRFGRWADRQNEPKRWVYGRVYWLMYRVVETVTGISISKGVEIGGGLRIFHFGNIVIHDGVRVGANCTLRQGTTIGSQVAGGPVPVLEDDVDVGAYGQILGGVRIGRGASIGAMSVVLRDVPPGATAVGIPARILDGDDNAGLLAERPIVD